MIPITYGQLLSGTTGEQLKEAFTLVQGIAGEQLWERFYQGANVTTEQYVPIQLGCIMTTSLGRAETAMKKYSKDYDFADKAKEKFMELQKGDHDAKHRRTGPYSPC